MNVNQVGTDYKSRYVCGTELDYCSLLMSRKSLKNMEQKSSETQDVVHWKSLQLEEASDLYRTFPKATLLQISTTEVETLRTKLRG